METANNTQPALLVSRLRALADEIESAHRFGVVIPPMVSVSGHAFGDAGFAATREEFREWADYCVGTQVEEYDNDGKHWWRATVNVNGLPVRFSTVTSPKFPTINDGHGCGGCGAAVRHSLMFGSVADHMPDCPHA